ncbi:hypothetical protein BH23GEM6_BH23GEM6_16160 [soil metagenome]
MRIRTTLLLIAGLAITAGCQADREVYEQGVPMEPPQEVQDAPAWPAPPQPIGAPAPTDTAIVGTLGQAEQATQPPR